MSDKAAYGAYADYAEQFEAGFESARRAYATMYPPPVRGADTDGWWTTAGLAVVMVASVLVSGSRTFAEFGAGGLGLAGTVMLEGTAVIYSFFLKRHKLTDDKVLNTHKLARRGLALALMVAIMANLHAVLREKSVGVADWVNTVILLAVAVSASLLAFISADILAIEVQARRQRRGKIEEQYAEALKVWNEDLLAYWKQQQAKLGVRFDKSALDSGTDKLLPRPSAVRPADEADTDSGHGTGVGYSKRTDARAVVFAYLDEHPEAVKMPARELAEIIGVGKTTAADARREWAGRKQE